MSQSLERVGEAADGPEEPLLSDDARQRASDPSLYQLVWLDSESVGLAITTFDDKAAAEAKLASLGPDEFGEGGGVIFKGGKIVKEKLILKNMLKEDFEEFLQRATETPAETDGPDDAAKLDAVVAALSQKLDELTGLAPEIGKLATKYKAKGLDAPEPVYGRPSPALIEFARLFPQYVSLGGCVPPS